jgi:hypothetical protein
VQCHIHAVVAYDETKFSLSDVNYVKLAKADITRGASTINRQAE